MFEEGHVQRVDEVVVRPPPQLVREAHAPSVRRPVALTLSALGQALEGVHLEMKEIGILVELLEKLGELCERHPREVGVRIWSVRAWLHSL